MSFGAHFRFGYLAQIASFLSLALANIALPNILGVNAFAFLNEAMAFVGISCIVFNEGVSYLIIRRIRETSIYLENSGHVLTQSACEHFLLACIALGIMIAIIDYFIPAHHYTSRDWLLICLTALMVAAYIPCIAVLTATMRNHVLLMFALLNGGLSFILPILLNHFGSDIRFSIALTYGICFAISIIYFRIQGMDRYFNRINLRNRIFLHFSLLPLIAPTALRLTIIWIPVIFFANIDSASDAAAYKIATSIAFGALAFVPFHKQTILSIEGNAPKAFMDTIAPSAILIAGIGGVFLISITGLITHTLYSVDFYMLTEYLPVLGLFVVLQIAADIALVKLIGAKLDKLILTLCLNSMLLAITALYFVELRWYPVVCAGLFCLLFNLIKSPFSFSKLALRATAASLLAVSATYLVKEWLGFIFGMIVLIFAMILDKKLRACIIRTLIHFLPKKRVRLG